MESSRHGAVTLLEDKWKRHDDNLSTLLAAMDEPPPNFAKLLPQDKTLRGLWRSEVERLQREWNRITTLKQDLATSQAEMGASMDDFLDYATDPVSS
jgi:hypothetical protein